MNIQKFTQKSLDFNNSINFLFYSTDINKYVVK